MKARPEMAHSLTKNFNGIQTRIIGVDGEHADLSTTTATTTATTMAQLQQFVHVWVLIRQRVSTERKLRGEFLQAEV